MRRRRRWNRNRFRLYPIRLTSRSINQEAELLKLDVGHDERLAWPP